MGDERRKRKVELEDLISFEEAVSLEVQFTNKKI